MADCNCDNIILTAGGEIRPTADSATAINIANSAGTDFVTFDTASRTVKIGNSNIAGNLELPDAYALGNPTFRVVTDHPDPGFTAIINNWGNEANPGVLVGTTQLLGGAFQVRSGVTLTGGLPNNSGTTRLYVGADGKVGIGTTQPSVKLEIQDGADDIVEIEKTGSGARRWVFGIGSAAPVGGFFIADLNVPARRLVIDTVGNVGIGATIPAKQLHVAATARINTIDLGVAQPYALSRDVDTSVLDLTGGTATIFGSTATDKGGEIVLSGGTRSGARGTVEIMAGAPTNPLVEIEGTIVFYTGGAQRVRIDRSGYVGIGITGPAAPLHVRSAGGSGPRFDFYSDPNIFVQFTESSGPRIDFSRPMSTSLKFRSSTDGTNFFDRMRLNGDGSLDVGATLRKAIDSNGACLYAP